MKSVNPNKWKKWFWLVLILLLLIFGGSFLFQPTRPGARYGAKMVYDPAGRQMILFGGRGYGLLGEKYYNDTWSLDLLSLSWQKLNVSNKPTARLSPGMVSDPVNHQLIMFGGMDKQGRLADTWILNLDTLRWDDISSAIHPPPRSDMGLAIDQGSGIVLLFGGYCQADFREFCDDTWVFEVNTGRWSEIQPLSSPPITYGVTMDFDVLNQQFLLWGGHMSKIEGNKFSSAGYNDILWSFAWENNQWQVLDPGSSTRPSMRYWHQATINSSTSELFIFGGDGGHGFLADNWLFDLETNLWLKIKTAQAPSRRVLAAIAFDPEKDQVILFGGLEEEQVDLNDTWIFQASDQGADWIQIK